jgi:YidC/Oxa1 family membrane protein insertase
MVWIMDVAHKVIPDWGIAIIILVIIVRVLLHPLTKYGQVHMLRFSEAMKTLGPKMKALQEKFKDDKAAQAQAMQALYAQEKVSPAGPMLGCLPMVIQMPIWVALYYGISHSIELRHEPFWPVYWLTRYVSSTWMADLSAPDQLIFWGGNFTLPLIGSLFQMGPIQALNVLPFGMGFFMYLNQKLMPQASAPGANPEQEATQRVMLKVMPWFFAFIMYNMPSGLNLYIMTSMAIGVVEQKRIRRHFYELHPEADPSRKAALGEPAPATAAEQAAKDAYLESWRARTAEKRRRK